MGKRKTRRPAANYIKTCFKDVTVEELLSIRRHAPREVLAALSSLSREEVDELSTEEVLSLYDLVSYIDDLNEVAAHLAPDFEAPAIDTASDTFQKAELAKKAIQAGAAPYRLLIDLVRIYYGEDAISGPAVPVLATGALILQDLTALFERFKDLGAEPPNEDELEAGVEALHSFGPYGMVESIAAKYHVRPFEVFSWTAEEVYLELTYQLAKSRYAENLREIEKRRNAVAKK